MDNLLKELRAQAAKDGKQVVSLAKKLFISVGAGATPEGKVPVTISVGSPSPNAIEILEETGQYRLKP